MKKQEKVITQYSKKCPHCKKDITGYSESQVKYNLKLHIEAKHVEQKEGGKTPSEPIRKGK